MKKNGFTLAEILITLAIIGVVAVLTIPSLMTNTGEQQALTAYKKIINSLNEAGQLSAAVDGFDYSSVTGVGKYGDSARKGDTTLAAILYDRLSVNEAGTGALYSIGKKDHCSENKTGGPVLTLRDGTGVCLNEVGYYSVDSTSATLPSKPSAATTNTDLGNSIFLTLWVDTNGPKGPNRASTCKEEACTDRNNKRIYDQFPVTLYKGMAIPGHWDKENVEGTSASDYAARYAMGFANKDDKKK